MVLREPDHRTIEELLDAACEAPTFGTNARELILQAARQISQESGDNAGVLSKDSDKDPKSFLRSLFKEAPKLTTALPKEERPLIPFKAIHSSKVPRVNRQSVVERLTGQHLALALNGAGHPVIPAKLAAIPEQRKQAVKAALEQEEELYSRGRASKSVYLNFAARTNAGLWLEKTTNSTQTQAPSTQQESVPDTSARHTETTTADHEQSYSGPTQASVPSNIDTGPDTEQRPAKRQRKLPEAASLVEVDIDWDVPHNSAAENDTSNSPDNGQSPAKLPPQEGKPSTVGPSSQIAAPQLTLPPKSAKLPVGRPNIGSERASEALPEGAVSAQGLEDYSPSRHGGESPPPRSLSVLHPQETPLSKPDSPPGDPGVLQALIKYLKSQLDPLYDARAISRSAYKRVMQKTVEKVMRSHAAATSPHFLIREGAKISKLMLQYVERETSKTDL